MAEINIKSILKKSDAYFLHEGHGLFRVIVNQEEFNLDSLIDKHVVAWFNTLPYGANTHPRIELLAIEELKIIDISHLDRSGDGAEIIVNYPSTTPGVTYSVLKSYTEGGFCSNEFKLDELDLILRKLV